MRCLDLGAGGGTVGMIVLWGLSDQATRGFGPMGTNNG
jgi:hypothetical protein